MEKVDQHNHQTDQHKKKLYDAHEHDLKFHVEKKTLIIWVRNRGKKWVIAPKIHPPITQWVASPKSPITHWVNHPQSPITHGVMSDCG
jgi:hypothetical protein